MSGAISGAVIGGIFGNKSASKAADASRDTTQAQLDYQRAAEDRARADMEKYYQPAMDRRNQGYQQSLDFFSNALPLSMQAQSQGNMAAQNVNYGAAPQMANAILGNAVNYDFMKPQQFDYTQQLSDLLAGVPKLYDPENQNQNTIPQPDIGMPPPVDTGFGGGAGGGEPYFDPRTGNMIDYQGQTMTPQQYVSQLMQGFGGGGWQSPRTGGFGSAAGGGFNGLGNGSLGIYGSALQVQDPFSQPFQTALPQNINR